ncbi:MAG: hypothetical protein H0W74_06265 [Sphingosinicella sp.]|nr:hypothetical protein [Sphingosinicella sp.]
MSKPPISTPHSDLDGVREDQRHIVDAAKEAGQDSADLARADKHSVGRPARSDDKNKRDDRTG